MRHLALVFTVVAALVIGLVSTNDRAIAHEGHSIPVCCAWNGSLNDSDGDGSADLTYSITGGGELDRATVRAAVEEWEAAGLQLIPVSSNDRTANIKIKLSKGGGVVAGSAKRNFDKLWFVKSVNVSISLKAFGQVNDQAVLAEVTRHEVGHGLGLGHANFDDLMDPTVGGRATISACDVNGVQEANRWKLLDGGSTPAYPSADHVDC